MPRQALTHEDIETFRQRAVETATRLYAEEGYEAVTMRSLAHALGCSPMKTYRYFENRDELFALVRIDAFRRFADEQRQRSMRQGPRDTLLKLKEAYIAFATREPHAYAIMFQLTPFPRITLGLMKRAYEAFHSFTCGSRRSKGRSFRG